MTNWGFSSHRKMPFPTKIRIKTFIDWLILVWLRIEHTDRAETNSVDRRNFIENYQLIWSSSVLTMLHCPCHVLCRRLSCENDCLHHCSILNFRFEELANLTSKHFLRIFFKAFFMSFISLNDGIFAKSEKYIYQQFTIAIPHCHFYISHVSIYFQISIQPYSK